MKSSRPLKPESADDAREVRRRAMDFLARREHGREELGRKLTAKGFDRDVVAEALAVLVEEGLLSDTRYAGDYVHGRLVKGFGPVAIRAGLRERGVDETLARSLLEDPVTDWYALAAAAREKRFGPGVPADYRERARQMRFLQQRGFTPEQIQCAVGGD